MKYKLTARNMNSLDKNGVARTQVSTHTSIEAAQANLTSLESAGWTVEVTPIFETEMVLAEDLAEGDVIFWRYKEWTVDESLVAINKRGGVNVTVRSDAGQRGSLSLKATTPIEKVVS